jgi:membrane protease YdiL (CAAX protease family)
MLAVGLVVYAILTWIARSFDGAAEPPSHPVVDLLSEPTAFRVVMLFLIASVAAPIVEEIAFRGMLYGHLRGTVAPRIRLLSVLIAAVVSSVVFAIIHPQGVLFVPALGGLAVGFCIFRELRGSLVAPMVAHGINNAVTLTIGLTLMS